ARPFRGSAAMWETWRKLEHGADALEAWHLADRPRKGTRRSGADKREAEPVAMRQHGRERGANDAIGKRPAIGLLDMRAGMIDEVHVVHAGRTGRHAGETGQAAVDMLHDLLVGGLAALQHVLDQV